MDHQKVDYKGYVILPITPAETEGRYYGGYEISKDAKIISVRKNIFPGFLYRDAAITDSIERAKLEIDNLAGADGLSG